MNYFREHFGKLVPIVIIVAPSLCPCSSTSFQILYSRKEKLGVEGMMVHFIISSYTYKTRSTCMYKRTCFRSASEWLRIPELAQLGVEGMMVQVVLRTLGCPPVLLGSVLISHTSTLVIKIDQIIVSLL
jgi:hypothetical protein